MDITVEGLKKAIKKLGYEWYTDRPNMIGIRSTLDVPDSFNDFFCMVYNIPKMKSNLSLKNKQSWLNKWGFVGANGKRLVEDGISGKNTNYALEQYSKSDKEILRVYPITTDPGVYWLNHPMNKLGTAILQPGQWVDCWSIGYHKSSSHRALRQTGKVSVYRDDNRDDNHDLNEDSLNTGLFGINIHGSGRVTPSKQIGKWSAGCQVFSNWNNKEVVIDVCDNFKKETGNKFTYTLIKESDLLECDCK